MNETSPKLAVIATRMPYIDRRSLSEAWFSALHLASDGPPVAAARDRRNVTVAAAPSRHAQAEPEKAITTARTARQPRANGNRFASQCRDRDAPHVRCTRRRRGPSVVRARTELSAVPHRADARCERRTRSLLLRREGAILHVVALCRPEIAATVRRALACADAHVRMRGEAIRSSVEIVLPGAVTA